MKSRSGDRSHRELVLNVVSLRYSSWSMRAWLALTHAGARFETRTAELPEMQRQHQDDGGQQAAAVPDLGERRRLGSVTGLFPVLWVDDMPIHEALAICEWAAEAFPEAGLWPEDSLARAQARSVCCEMAAGFTNLRAELSCHLFARVPPFELRPETRREVERVCEIWQTRLEACGGPFLSGRFGVVDCMYYPVLTRFRTYGVALPDSLEQYARTVEAAPAVAALWRQAADAPAIAIYDDYVRRLGGDPDGLRPRRG